MGTAYRYCPDCRGEFRDWLDRCPDCDVPLVDDLIALPEPPAVARALADVRDGSATEDGQGAAPASRVRPDRRTRVVPPPIRSAVEPPASARGAGVPRRIVARFVDGWIAGTAVFLLTNATAWPVWPWSLVAIVALTGAESMFGRTPGKLLLGLRVEGPDGWPPTLAAASVRNAFQLIGFIPVVGGWAELGVVLAIVISIAADAERRGVHDQLAGTIVVATREELTERVRRAGRPGTGAGTEPPSLPR